MAIEMGCETYTWLMPGPEHHDLTHIMTVVGKSGFTGVEPMNIFLNGLDTVEKMAEQLDKNGIKLHSLALVLDWLNPEETAEEKAEADKMIELVKAFSGCILMPCQMPTTRPEDADELKVRQDNMLNCVHAVCERAVVAGVECSYHPNSPDTSIWRTPADYDRLLPLLNGDVCGWTPDLGHMAKGGLDLMKYVKEFRPIINHLHLKDMYENGDWALMGEGTIDFVEIAQYLIETGFDGYIIAEDESDYAEKNPDEATFKIAKWMIDNIGPIIP
jgi:inosose dehydratase